MTTLSHSADCLTAVLMLFHIKPFSRTKTPLLQPASKVGRRGQSLGIYGRVASRSQGDKGCPCCREGRLQATHDRIGGKAGEMRKKVDLTGLKNKSSCCHGPQRPTVETFRSWNAIVRDINTAAGVVPEYSMWRASIPRWLASQSCNPARFRGRSCNGTKPEFSLPR